MIRSKLFVPGSRPELFEKAAASAADALSFDLEDAVSADKKFEARANIAGFLRNTNSLSGKVSIVRVNPVSSRLFSEDVQAVVGPGLDVINLPKVESRDEVLAAIRAIANAEKAQGLSGKIAVLANVESPKGLRFASEIATADRRVAGLQIGFKDLLARWGIDSRDAVAQQFVRLQVRLAAAEAGIPAYDGAFTDVKNIAAFRAEAENAKRMGFEGKTCIHPSQIPVANEVFAPTTAQIESARKILSAASEAAARGEAVFTVEGEMVDEPVILSAKAVIELAAKLAEQQK
jgi:citrate lyase subunit beta/citryl-CoA lyase